jgi:hypothetical protein
MGPRMKQVHGVLASADRPMRRMEIVDAIGDIDLALSTANNALRRLRDQGLVRIEKTTHLGHHYEVSVPQRNLLKEMLEVVEKFCDGGGWTPKKRGIDIQINQMLSYALEDLETRPGWSYVGSGASRTCYHCDRHPYRILKVPAHTDGIFSNLDELNALASIPEARHLLPDSRMYLLYGVIPCIWQEELEVVEVAYEWKVWCNKEFGYHPDWDNFQVGISGDGSLRMYDFEGIDFSCEVERGRLEYSLKHFQDHVHTMAFTS